ncbi:glutathione S-transferase U9-like [Ziziphus jujuba]|uniref:Glutathione S-transferase n=1 Tax=Ziziphus jujuba TaxID=326968 RepID=A0A6P3YW44_ZIZJJ|nr:glutathione S-transferase U9-like [Ziziphus jujuba]
MAEENKVRLHGAWSSPYNQRVKLALKLKGIAYEYVEEDLRNKSPLLLKYNPVYKKIPVLVHNGKPVCESLVILEYIDETWRDFGPKLLPQDPFKRAQVRFWVSFIQQQLFEAMFSVLKTDGEAQHKAIKEVNEKLNILEEGMKNFFQASTHPVDGQNLGLLDIVICSILGNYKAQEQVLGIKIIDLEKTPLIFSWLTTLVELPVVKETLPPHEKIVLFLKYVRQNALKASKA